MQLMKFIFWIISSIIVRKCCVKICTPPLDNWSPELIFDIQELWNIGFCIYRYFNSVCDYAVEKKEILFVYWPPIKVHYGICASDLLDRYLLLSTSISCHLSTSSVNIKRVLSIFFFFFEFCFVLSFYSSIYWFFFFFFWIQVGWNFS